MHALNGKHIPYALNDDDDELDDNGSDDVFYDNDDGNDDDDHHRRHLCQCHHDYHNSHHHRHNHHSCHHHHHCPWHHHDYWHFHQLFIITFGIRNNIYPKYVISGKGSWRTHTIYAWQITTYFLRWSTPSFSLYSSSLSLSSSPSSSFISLPS